MSNPDGMTVQEVKAALKSNPGRFAFIVKAVGGLFVTEFEGREFVHETPFGLDSLLWEVFAPYPRSLYFVLQDEDVALGLIEEEDVQ